MNKTIVTGQQIGLLGGPLYTTYKVLGAIKLAERLQGRAVYWLETNDADFNEINHIEFLDAQGQLQRLSWQKNSEGYSCGQIEVDQALNEILVTFFKNLRQTEFTPQLKEVVFESYRPGKTLGEASNLLAQYLFAAFELEIFDPQKPEFRQATRPILLREAERTAPDQQCNLFYIKDKKRLALFKCGKKFCNRQGKIVELAGADLVPNVKTRNVCQDLYFNTHTYVAGPGEIKYIEELDPFYQYHQVSKARTEKRMSLTLIEPKVKRLFGKLKLEILDVDQQNRDEFVNSLLKKFHQFDAAQVLKGAKGMIDGFMRQLDQLDLETQTLRKKIYSQIKEMIGKKRARIKEEQADIVNKAGIIHDYLFPFGQRQERVFNIFYYMNLYGGREFIHRLFKVYENKLKFLEI